MTLWMSSIAFILALCCKDKDYKLPSQIFTSLYLIHAILFSGMDGFNVFMIAILFDVIAIMILSLVDGSEKLTKELISVSVFCMFFNVFAWYSWEIGSNYEGIYDEVALLLYLAIFIILIKGYDGRDNILIQSDSFVWPRHKRSFVGGVLHEKT